MDPRIRNPQVAIGKAAAKQKKPGAGRTPSSSIPWLQSDNLLEDVTGRYCENLAGWLPDQGSNLGPADPPSSVAFSSSRKPCVAAALAPLPHRAPPGRTDLRDSHALSASAQGLATSKRSGKSGPTAMYSWSIRFCLASGRTSIIACASATSLVSSKKTTPRPSAREYHSRICPLR